MAPGTEQLADPLYATVDRYQLDIQVTTLSGTDHACTLRATGDAGVLATHLHALGELAESWRPA